MARNKLLSLFCVFIVFSISVEFVSGADLEEKKQVYIVYLGAAPPQKGVQSPYALYSTILEGAGISRKSLIRSYTKSFGGFAASITGNEQKKLAAHDEVISIFPSKNLQLLTTQSWDFMGFSVHSTRNPTSESDIIIGHLDTGIWPTSASFSDNGFGPPPKKWKGVCNGGKKFTCNNKIIGARYYNEADDSALDTDGHGTHTASTAAGNEVQNASFFGIADGIARGAVPSARIAEYKVCNGNECREHDILSAFDDAISDGVDILCISIGRSSAIEFMYDAITIGSLHAFANGILTVHAAGNSAYRGSISSVAPWLFSVAASTTSRQLMSKVKLGNGNEEYGYSINPFNLDDKIFPLINGIDGSLSTCGDKHQQSSCGCLDSKKVKGKLILCDGSIHFDEVPKANGSGIIMPIIEIPDSSDIVSFAASFLSPPDFGLVERYYNSTKNPEASLFRSQSYINKTSPVVASFSSRGPNQILSDILKPDITAPGINILAAFPSDISLTSDEIDKRSTPFSIMSGTSMACPHVVGAAAYVKSNHPNWSPAAIKSALMTTAKQMNSNQSGDGNLEFSFGSGFLDPIKALNPGLVYETRKMDIVIMMCNSGYNNKTIGQIFGRNTKCPKRDVSTPKDLNYPTMAAKLNHSRPFSVNFLRTVTNVGQANSTYKAIVSKIPQISITVKPNVLSFKELNEKQSFVVTISGNISKTMISASLQWTDGIHTVRSPIVIYIDE